MGNKEQNLTLDFRFIAKKSIARKIDARDVDLKLKAKARIAPLLLGPYDETSLSEMNGIKDLLIEQGFVNTLLLRDIETRKDFKGEYDAKYIHSIHLFKEDKFLVLPLFYFPPKGRDHGIGHHGELVDLVMLGNSDHSVLLQAAYFHYESSEMLNHVRVITNNFLVSSFDEHKKAVVQFVNKNTPMIERKILLDSGVKKNFYSSKHYKKKRGGSHE